MDQFVARKVLGLGLGLLAFACGHQVSVSELSTSGGVGTSGHTAATGGVDTSGRTASTGGADASGHTSSTGGVDAAGLVASCSGAATASGASASSNDASVDATASECIIRVTQAGDDANDGRSWSEALETVQKAFDNATQLIEDAACTSVEIWVAAGSYAPTRRTSPTDARSATFQLVPHVALYGGFAGAESSRAYRDCAANVSTLSGDIGTPNDARDNSYHVVTGVTGATLDGFTITGGNAQGDAIYDGGAPDNSNREGGGMFNEGTSPTVANCTFVNNVAMSGGGMYNSGSSPLVDNCVFTKNQIGGGMFNQDASPTVKNCKFSNNPNGGMNNLGGSPMVTGCIFAGNSGKAWAWGGYGGSQYGGGMYNSSSSPIVTNCAFIGNTVSTGGAFTGKGGGMYNESSSPMVTNCTFTKNSAEYGGGIYSTGGSPILTNCILWGDTNGTGVNEIDANGSATVSTSIVQGGYTPGTNIITADPLFADAANGNVHLRADSPAIDAASGCAQNVTLTDLDGNSRWDIAGVPDVTNELVEKPTRETSASPGFLRCRTFQWNHAVWG